MLFKLEMGFIKNHCEMCWHSTEANTKVACKSDSTDLNFYRLWLYISLTERDNHLNVLAHIESQMNQKDNQNLLVQNVNFVPLTLKPPLFYLYLL